MKQSFIFILLCLLTGCLNYNLNKYLIISNYTEMKPAILDLSTGIQYGFRKDIINKKDFPYFRMLKVLPEQNEIIFLWTTNDYNSGDSLIEVHSMADESVKKYNFQEIIIWVDKQGDTIYYSTLKGIYSFINNIKKEVYIAGENCWFWQLRMIDKYICTNQSCSNNHNLIIIDLNDGQVKYREIDIIALEVYDNFIYCIKKNYKDKKLNIFELNVKDFSKKEFDTTKISLPDFFEFFTKIEEPYFFLTDSVEKHPLTSLFEILFVLNKDSYYKYYSIINIKTMEKKKLIGPVNPWGAPIIQVIPRNNLLKKYLSAY